MTDDVFQVQRDSTLCGMCGARLWQVTPVEDGRVVVEATLYQCPWCPQAPQDGPGVNEEAGPAEVAGGLGLGGEVTGGRGTPEGAPVASLAAQRAAHDERVARDVAAYQRLTGEQT